MSVTTNWETPVTIPLRLAMDLYQWFGYIENPTPADILTADEIVAAMDASQEEAES